MNARSKSLWLLCVCLVVLAWLFSGCAAPTTNELPIRSKLVVETLPMPQMLATVAPPEAPDPPQPQFITLEWNAGYLLLQNPPLVVELPRTSGVESTTDFIHWFAETNLPVNLYLQDMRVTLEATQPHQFFRAVDRY